MSLEECAQDGFRVPLDMFALDCGPADGPQVGEVPFVRRTGAHQFHLCSILALLLKRNDRPEEFISLAGAVSVAELAQPAQLIVERDMADRLQAPKPGATSEFFDSRRWPREIPID